MEHGVFVVFLYTNVPGVAGSPEACLDAEACSPQAPAVASDRQATHRPINKHHPPPTQANPSSA